MKELLALFYELARWSRVYLEIKSRTLLYDKKKEVDRDIKELENEIQKLRLTGNHTAADQLLLSQVRATCFERGLSSLAEGAKLYSNSESSLSGFGSSDAEGQVNSGTAKSISSR